MAASGTVMLNPDQRPSFADVARLIGEPRLEPVLKELAEHIHTDIHNAGFKPRRSKVRNATKKLKAEAQRFQKALDRMPVFLELPWPDFSKARLATQGVVDWCDQG
jgi:hypothetical protein